ALRLFVSPNPSAGEVALRYSLPGAEAPAIRVYDVRGRMVCALAAGEPLGLLVWDGTDAGGRSVAPGVYFVRLSGGEFSETTRITRVR
ncbi:MAG: T9SS C-terminal target domain-containing protein, partial [Candidatus Latescibacterota bacterium]